MNFNILEIGLLENLIVSYNTQQARGKSLSAKRIQNQPTWLHEPKLTIKVARPFRELRFSLNLNFKSLRFDSIAVSNHLFVVCRHLYCRISLFYKRARIYTIPISALKHTYQIPRYGQYLAHAHSHITRTVVAMDSPKRASTVCFILRPVKVIC